MARDGTNRGGARPGAGRIVGRDDDKEHFGLIESVEIQTDEGLVSRELWEKVQERINGPRRHRNSHFMCGTIYCEKFGFPMSRITVTLKGQKVSVWKCSQHIKSKELCPQGYIKEEELIW